MDDNHPSSQPEESFRFNISEENVYEIRSYGEFNLELVRIITQFITDYARAHVPPRGIVLDMREHTDLSMVRLSSLIDALNALEVPQAIVFHNAQYQQLAALLHRTLVNQDRVAYFTDWDEAYRFAAGHDRPGTEDPTET